MDPLAELGFRYRGEVFPTILGRIYKTVSCVSRARFFEFVEGRWLASISRGHSPRDLSDDSRFGVRVHPVAAILLGAIQRLIRTPNQFLGPFRRFAAVAGDTQADREMP